MRSKLLDCNTVLGDCAIVLDTAYIGNHTEWNVLTNEMKRYYRVAQRSIPAGDYAGAQRIAMRVVPQEQAGTVSYILGDHLGSTSLTVNTGGIKTGELRYKAFAP